MLALALGPLAHAQVVRGVVRDSATGAPLPGVVVALDEADGPLLADESLRRSSLVLAVLTNDRGEYALRAARTGRYRLSAKQVGSRRFVSAAFALAVGEQQRMDVRLARIDFALTLPPVTTLTDAPCAVRAGERERVAALWEEARTALTASRLALRDRVFRASIQRYVRELRPQGLRVIREDRSTREGVTEHAFESIAADRLSSEGYVVPDGEGAWTFHAPDAAVLTSSAFLRDHCFSLAADTRRHPGAVGLAFEPVESRRLSDVRGALWLDSATAALRSVEFQYVNLDERIRRADARGEVHFERTAGGSWFVRRWFIRMPQYARTAQSSAMVQRASSGPELVSYREEGGDVRVFDNVTSTSFASLRGMLMDSSGRAPLRGATVRLAGTQFETRARSDGSFRLDSLPVGAYTLLVEHPGYAALGMLAGEQELELAEASESVTALQAPGTQTILRRLCAIKDIEPEHAVVRVLVRTAADSAVPPGTEVRATWQTFERQGVQTLARVPYTERIAADDLGAATFCMVPGRVPVRVETGSGAEDGRIAQELRLVPQTITVVQLRRR